MLASFFDWLEPKQAEIEVVTGRLENGPTFRLLVAEEITTDQMRQIACLLYGGADKADATSQGKKSGR